VAPADRADDWTWSARDVDGDGRADLVIRQGRAPAKAWISDGRGFTEAPSAVPAWAALSPKRGRE
ncbi:MAG TPA: hypothetical protein VHB97_10905, partial [Polyangia bacterium]|jgi:hypothetical protein|nr:hypothetical protein [Polyangia bacterium]